MKDKLMYFLARLREPSSMAGLTAFALMFGVPPGTLELSMQVLTGVLAGAAILLPEKK